MMYRFGLLRMVGMFALCLLLGGCEIDEMARMVDDACVVARIGVIANPEVGWITETGMLERALRFYRQEGVNAVVIAGNVTRNGYRNQYEVLDRVWRKVFVGSDVRLIKDEGTYEVGNFKFGVLNRIPMDYCEDLSFCGEGKHALTDDLRFYDRAYNVMYAGSMSDIVIRPGFEYCGKLSNGTKVVARQGLLVSVYSSKVRVRRLDFTQSRPVDRSVKLSASKIYAEDLAEEFVLPRGAKIPPDAGKAPEFWSDTRIQTLPGFRDGKKVITVRWPNVLKRHTGVRAYCYEVSVNMVTNEGTAVPYRRKHVLPKGFLLSEDRDLEPVSCVLDMDELMPAGQDEIKIAVQVIPIGSRGARGKPMSTESMVLRR